MPPSTPCSTKVRGTSEGVREAAKRSAPSSSPDPENDRNRRMLPTIERVDRAAKLVKNPLADVTAMAAVLRDQRGTDDVQRPPGHRGVIDDGRAAHVVILDPTSLELWVGDPKSAGRMRAFDLRQ